MAAHQISPSLIDQLTVGPSQTKREQVANLQNHIQELLRGTHHTFLQGSYSNFTAISDINDVDIVAVRNTVVSGIHSPHRHTSNTKVGWEELFSEIEGILKAQNKYTWTLSRGDKCIKIRGSFRADVVPAVKYHEDAKSDPVVVYSWKGDTENLSRPRTHNANTTVKHVETKERYRPIVRMFKNWARNHFGDEVISSFRMQALVHSVENDKFYDDYVFSFILVGHAILQMLESDTAVVMSVCGHEDIVRNWSPNDKALFKSQLLTSLGHAHTAYKATNTSSADLYWRAAHNL